MHAGHTMSILKYFRPLREKPDLPDPSAPLRETVPPTATVEANVKVSEALNEAELKTEKCKPGLWNALISDASAEVWSREKSSGIWRNSHNPPLRDYKYPDRKAVCVDLRTYQAKSWLPIGAPGLETPGFARVAQQKDRTSAIFWRENQQIQHYLADLRKRLYESWLWPMYLLGYPVSQDSFVPSMGTLQTSLYSWYPLTTLNIVNACTIFRGTRNDKINDCGLFNFSVAYCNWRTIIRCNSPKFSPPTSWSY